MQFSNLALVAASIMAPVLAQTPPGTSPATSGNLAVTYGTTKVAPGNKLPATLTSTIPMFNHIPTNPNQTYSLLLVDLSINNAQVNTSQLTPGIQVPLTAGIAPGRTTRLHYWQPGVTFSSNGTLINTTSPIAFYQGPAPPPGDIAHTYVFYLFEQGKGFSPPPEGNPFSTALVNVGVNRYSFNVNHLANETGIGPLVAANYIEVQNTAPATSSGGATATGSGGASTSGTGNVPAPSVPPFTGDAGKIRMGLVGGVMTIFAVGMALLFLY